MNNNMDKNIDDEKCQYIILDLLKMNHETMVIPSSSYIRLWKQSLRCSGKIKETCEERLKDYERYINDCDKTAFSRLIGYNYNENDKELAKEVISHYRRDDKRVLVSNLTWKSWFKYHLYEKSDFTTGVITIGTSLVFGYILGNKIRKFIYNRKFYFK